MFEEDPAEITVHLVQFEKNVPFCMPGAEDTNAFVVTWLRRGGRTNVAVPFGRGGVVCVHHGGRCALGLCMVGVVSRKFCVMTVGKGLAAVNCVVCPQPWGGPGRDPLFHLLLKSVLSCPRHSFMHRMTSIVYTPSTYVYRYVLSTYNSDTGSTTPCRRSDCRRRRT